MKIMKTAEQKKFAMMSEIVQEMASKLWFYMKYIGINNYVQSSKISWIEGDNSNNKTDLQFWKCSSYIIEDINKCECTYFFV